MVENIRFNPDIKTSAGDIPSIIKFSSFCVYSLFIKKLVHMIDKFFVLLPFVIDVRLPIQLHFPIKVSLSRFVAIN